MENTKRDLSLDFTKPRVPRGGQPVPSLVTPILNLSTPELNKLISEEELAVLTPNGISSVISQSNILPCPLIPTTVNNSNNIINNNNSNNGTNNTNHHTHHVSSTHQNQNGNGKKTAATESNASNNKQIIRQEIDIEKIEKKRERNRLAAKKCRQRKLETIDELRRDVKQWEQKYKKLENDFEHLKSLRTKEIEALRRENSDLRAHLNRQ